MESLDQEIVQVVGICIVVVVIALLIMVILLSKRLNALTVKYHAMIGHTGIANLEEIITELQDKVKNNLEHHLEHKLLIQQLQNKLSLMKGNVAMKRYNAFNETGSDLSFSIAIVDDHNDGLVFTVIHGREESYSYGKPLIRGESKYPLSPEELDVINSALKKSQNHA